MRSSLLCHSAVRVKLASVCNPLGLSFVLESDLSEESPVSVSFSFGASHEGESAKDKTDIHFDNAERFMESAYECFQFAKGSFPSLKQFSVPVCMNDLADADFCERIIQVKERMEIKPHELRLDVYVGEFHLEVFEIREGMRRLLGNDIHFALNHTIASLFGSNYIHNFPFCMIKLDFSCMGDAGDTLAIHAIKRMISLCDRQGMELMVDGISRLNQKTLLAELGCQKGSGSLFHFNKERRASAATKSITCFVTDRQSDPILIA